jgi:hypothetical protein
MSTSTDETNEKLSFSDMVGSLTGYEEVAIEERFGQPVGHLMRAALTKAGRALIFIDEQRKGAKAPAAYKAAMELRLEQVNERFFDDDEDADDFDPDNPDTELGKDGSSSD